MGTRIEQLPAGGVLVGNEPFEGVEDPSGTPDSKKWTADQIAARAEVVNAAATRPPTTHAASHGSGGSDEITLDAGTQLTGTVPDGVLPGRLGSLAHQVSDWNLATENGFYFSDAAALNRPDTGGYLGYVQAVSASSVTQIAHRYAADGSPDTHMWARSRDGGSWGTWYRLRVSEDEIASFVETALSLLDLDAGVSTEVLRARGAFFDGTTPPRGLCNRETNALCRMRATVDNGADTVTLSQELNVASIVRVDDATFDVTFRNAIGGAVGYTVIPSSSADTRVYTQAHTASGFRLRLNPAPGGVFALMFTLHGKDITA